LRVLPTWVLTALAVFHQGRNLFSTAILASPGHVEKHPKFIGELFPLLLSEHGYRLLEQGLVLVIMGGSHEQIEVDGVFFID
jgi:hypothetical protein